ncbi:serine/threonine-protein kinase [Kribbella italica]|uniref:non-specific serine/threonine protein kinase n=1 Tax=Kribbella italica TaxID=1540520 RepID=A0A7W9J9B0_9ACTN|nr:serine/threonine-protein kinase [Kribbella italica]
MNGEVLAGRYRLLSLLGRGGAGEVWRGEDTVLARPVAIKLLRALDGDPMDEVQRFRIEAQAAARLQHPNVVATYDVGAADDQVFLVMELVTGTDLAQLMRSKGLPGTKLVADIAVQGSRALDAAHGAGIIHRDVKPANLLLAGDGTLKITDFGLAHAGGLNGATGQVLLGTAAYISPEQVTGGAATTASDWYSLGCVLYELLEGVPPYVADTVEGVLRQHLEAPVPPVRRTDEVPGLAGLVEQMLAKDPAQRPSSSAAVLALLSGSSTQVLPIAAPTPPPLEEELLGAPVEARTTSHVAPERRSLFTKVLVGAAVLVVGVMAAALLREGVSQDPPAQAGGTPTVAPTVASKVTTKPKATPTPTPKPKVTPSPKKTPKKSPSKPAETGTVGQLRTLAQLLRQGRQGEGSKAVREAAKDLDQAAKALGEDDDEEAAQQYRSALRRLGNAQRSGQWQPTPQQFVLIAAVNRDLGRSGYGQGDNEERDSDE